MENARCSVNYTEEDVEEVHFTAEGDGLDDDQANALLAERVTKKLS